MELGRCKTHQSHKQTRGVCPFCLRERLSQVTASSASSTSATIHSSSSYDHSTASESSAGESPRRVVRHHRAKTLLHLLRGGAAEPLGRSRSMAFPMGEERLEKEQKKASKRSGRRFWSGLMLAGAGRTKEGDEGRLHHSKTVKEKSSSKWSFFSY